MTYPESESAQNRAALDVALAEFRVVRDEMHVRINAQALLVVPVVAVLSLAGAIVEARPWIPLLAMGLGLALSATRLWINFQGQYIREYLWPEIRRLSGSYTNYEVYSKQVMWGNKPRLVAVSVLEAGVPLLLFVYSIAMIALAGPVHILLLVLDWIAIGLIGAAPIAAVYVNRSALGRIEGLDLEPR